MKGVASRKIIQIAPNLTNLNDFEWICLISARRALPSLRRARRSIRVIRAICVSFLITKVSQVLLIFE